MAGEARLESCFLSVLVGEFPDKLSAGQAIAPKLMFRCIKAGTGCFTSVARGVLELPGCLPDCRGERVRDRRLTQPGAVERRAKRSVLVVLL